MLNEITLLEMQAMRTSVEPTYRDVAREMREVQKSVLEHAKEKGEEAWKPITGTWGKYLVSNWGRVRRGDKFLTGFLNRKHLGYCMIQMKIRGESRYVLLHRLVAREFLPPRPSKDHGINHKDCNRFNNCDWNLEWATQLENMQHASRNGRLPEAQDKHPVEIIESMIQAYLAGEPVNSICARHGSGYGPLYEGLRGRGIPLRGRHEAEREAQEVNPI